MYMYRIIIIALACWLAAAPAWADERQRMIDAFTALKPSVASLYAHEPDGDFSFLCSATAIEHHDVGGVVHTVVLTAQHCLRKGVSYALNFGDGSFRPAWPWMIPHYEADPKNSPRAYGEPQTDMTLFLIAGDDIPLVPVAASSALPAGTKIAMMGFPLGVAKISYEGIVAGTFARPGADQNGYLLLQIFGAPGSSGSSVVAIDAEGGFEVVAVLVSAKQQSAGLPVIFATPIEYRRHLSPARPESAP